MQRREKLMSAAVGAALLAFGAAAQAQQPLQVELSGQVNRAIMHADDGIDSDLFNVDNDNSSTRFRFTGSQGITANTKAGVVFEVEYQSSPSNSVSFGGSAPSPSIDERIMELFFQSSWGKLSLGQGDGAANGGVEVDLSGTTVAHYSDVSAFGGGIAFRTAAGGAGPTVSTVLSNQDFESRYDRLRYDSPNFAGFEVAASLGNKDADNREVTELALRYAGKGSLGELAAAVGYSSQDAAAPGGQDDNTIGGSVSWLHGSGLNLTAGTTTRERTPTRDGKFNYFKVGYKWGDHALSADVGQAKDQNAAGDKADVMGIAYVYKVVSWAELYAMARSSSLEQPGIEYEDVRVMMAGARLKF